MKNRLPYALLAVCAAFLLPVLLTPAPPRAGGDTSQRVEEGINRGEKGPWGESAGARAEGLASVGVPAAVIGGADTPQAGSGPSPGADAALTLTVRTKTGDRQMTMAEYLPLAIAGEMPASFELEALKAQAVTLRTYVLRQREQPKANHPAADVCTDSSCCAAFGEEEVLRTRWNGTYDAYMERLRAAVADTDGQYLRYEGSPALTVFHASSYRSTEDGAALGVPLPYLVSVASPETPMEVSSLKSTVEVTPAEFRETLRNAYPGAALDGVDPAAWLGPVALDAAGRVDRVELGGVSVSGLELRRLFSLRSTDFSLAWDGERFIFRVNGYGHGLGMSQYGANLLAKDGTTYGEILAHYYPGTELCAAS